METPGIDKPPAQRFHRAPLFQTADTSRPTSTILLGITLVPSTGALRTPSTNWKRAVKTFLLDPMALLLETSARQPSVEPTFALSWWMTHRPPSQLFIPPRLR